MRERPDGVRLLELARQALLDELVPALPQEHRYTARLAANAIAISARELAAGDTALKAERAALERLLGADHDGSTSLADTESLDEALQRLNWRLAAEVRAGGRDADVTTHGVLLEIALARLKLVKPGPRSGKGEDGRNPA